MVALALLPLMFVEEDQLLLLAVKFLKLKLSDALLGHISLNETFLALAHL